MSNTIPFHPYEVPRGKIILGGRSYPCAVETKIWHEHGMEFKPGKGARKRGTNVPDLIVGHYTGGEGSGEGVYRVLNERDLGIEFVVDRGGCIYQYCDPLFVDTYDAGAVNARSIGIEVVSQGLAPLKSGNEGRGTYEAKIHGRKVQFAGYYSSQLYAFKALCDTLTLALGIPRSIAIPPRVLTDSELKAHKGLIGHYHVTANKVDPGTQVWEYLSKQGYDWVKPPVVA